MNVRRGAIAFLAVALIASAALALDIPPKPTQWVNDYGANTLTASETQQLNEKLEGFYKRTGVQFLVMIFPSLEGEDDLGYTNKVANVWKVKDDKALMLFVFMKEHKTRIQVGYSMEPVITDAFSADVLSGAMRTAFKAGDYAGGLNTAVDQIWRKVDPNSVPAGASPAPVHSNQSPRVAGIPMRMLIYILLFVVIGVVQMFSRRGRRSGCGGCFWPMMFLGGGGGGTTFGGGGGGGGGWGTGGSWGGGGSSFGGGGAGGGW